MENKKFFKDSEKAKPGRLVVNVSKAAPKSSATGGDEIDNGTPVGAFKQPTTAKRMDKNFFKNSEKAKKPVSKENEKDAKFDKPEVYKTSVESLKLSFDDIYNSIMEEGEPAGDVMDGDIGADPNASENNVDGEAFDDATGDLGTNDDTEDDGETEADPETIASLKLAIKYLKKAVTDMGGDPDAIDDVEDAEADVDVEEVDADNGDGEASPAPAPAPEQQVTAM